VTLDLVALMALAGILAGVVLAAAMLTRLRRLARQPEIARAPLAASGPVVFADGGHAELALEGPAPAAGLRALRIEMLDATGLPLRLDPLRARAASGGIGRRRLSLHAVDVPAPGTYQLRVGGLDETIRDGRTSIVFVRPQDPGFVATAAALVAAIGLAAGSVAVAGALLFQPAPPEAPVPAPRPRPAPVEPRLPDVHDGRILTSDPKRLDGARDLVWPLVQMHVRIPADWVVRKLTDTELDVRDPTTPSTFVVARADVLPAGPTFDQYLTAEVAHARERLATHAIDGYTTRRLGTMAGVLTTEQRDDGALGLIRWTGFASAAIGSVSVTVVAGAAGGDFARTEPLLGAIVGSIRFE
jgi:hypothetical protein